METFPTRFEDIKVFVNEINQYYRRGHVRAARDESSIVIKYFSERQVKIRFKSEDNSLFIDKELTKAESNYLAKSFPRTVTKLIYKANGYHNFVKNFVWVGYRSGIKILQLNLGYYMYPKLANLYRYGKLAELKLRASRFSQLSMLAKYSKLLCLLRSLKKLTLTDISSVPGIALKLNKKVETSNFLYMLPLHFEQNLSLMINLPNCLATQSQYWVSELRKASRHFKILWLYGTRMFKDEELFY